MGPRTLLVVAFCLVAIAGASIPAQSASFGIDVTGSADVPDRTVTFQQTDYVITAIAREHVDGTLQVQTTAPSGSPYRLYLYNSDQTIVDSSKETGSATVTFDLTGLSVGTYMLTIYDGDYRAVYPVVVEGYSVDVTSPSAAEPGADVSVSVQAAPTAASGSPSRVEVVLADAEHTVRTTATHQTGDQYEAVVSLDGLDAGTYHLYAVAQGSNQAFGHYELLGVSDSHTVTIQSETGGGGGGGGGGSQTSQTTVPQTTPGTTGTPAVTPRTTETGDSTSGTTEQPPTHTQSTTATPTPWSHTPTANGNVITPAEPTATEPTTSPGQDAPTLLVLVALAIVGAGLFRNR